MIFTKNGFNHGLKKLSFDYYLFAILNSLCKRLVKTKIPADRISWETLVELNKLNEKRSIKLLQAVISELKFTNDAKW